MTGLRVLAYNVWGMPRQVGGQNKSVRMPAIASLLKERKEEFDIILLSELWYETDHGIIKQAMDEAGMFMTSWGDFNSSLSPGYSSGLAIISRQTPDGVTPLFFKNRGHFSHFDGEWVARKGACHLYFQALSIGTETVSADVVVTHLIGDRFDSHGQDSNEAIRLKQATELLSYIDQFDSDLTILGGDLNTEPSQRTYKVIEAANFKDAGAQGGTKAERETTFANPENSYTDRAKVKPMTLDYIFIKSNRSDITSMQTVEENVFRFSHEGRTKSLSDHSPVLVSIDIGKQGDRKEGSLPSVDFDPASEGAREASQKSGSCESDWEIVNDL